MKFDLVPHLETMPRAVDFVTAQLHRERGGLQILYVVECDPARLLLPPPQQPYRADGLWRTTCFELFVRDPEGAYREFNFSPSGQWAAYAFQAYRDGGEPLALNEPPTIQLSPEPFGILLSVSVAVELQPNAHLGLSAVIEEKDGTKSYWALAHPQGKPDFHHPDCFAAELSPPA
jgi:hypothetical protein